MGLKRNSDLDRELLPATSLGKGHEIAKQDNIKRRAPAREWVKLDLSQLEPLAYLLGLIKGDAHIDYSTEYEYPSGIYRPRKFVLSQTRSELSKTTETALRAIGLHPKTRFQPRKPPRKPLYVTVAVSKEFAEWYGSLPKRDFEKIVLSNDTTVRAFIKGFYESEGSSSFSGAWTISISNTDRELLLFTQQLLQRLGYTFRFRLQRKKKKKWKESYELEQSRWHENVRFLKEITPCIKNGDYSDRFSKIYKKWSKDEVIKNLRLWAERQGETPRYGDVPPPLSLASRRHFSTWNNAVRHSNLTVYGVRRNEKGQFYRFPMGRLR